MKSIKNLAECLRLISDYRARLAGIRSSVATESRILRAALKRGKELIYKSEYLDHLSIKKPI